MSFYHDDGILIKFYEKQEYVDNILNGSFFMRSVESINRLSDSFRGDPLEGYRVLEASSARVEWRGVTIPLPPTEYKFSYVGIQRIPVFSAVQLDEQILEETSEGIFKFKRAFVDHMEQFGKYVVTLCKKELIRKITTYADKNHYHFCYGNVSYVNSSTPPPESDDWKQIVDEYVF